MLGNNTCALRVQYTSAPAEEPAAPAEHEAGVEEQPEEIAEDFRSTYVHMLLVDCQIPHV